jgi:hypothetical protein
MAAVTELDPLLAKRRRIQRLAEVGQRIGYSLFGFAMFGFFVALATGFSSIWVTIIITAIIVGSVFLAPAIVAGYAVKAADREDREQGR